AYRDEHVVVGRVAKGVDADATQCVEHDRLPACERKDVMQMPGGGMARPQAQAIDPPGGPDQPRCLDQPSQGGGLCEPCHLSVDDAHHLGSEKMVAFELLVLGLRPYLPGKAGSLAAHRIGIELTHVFVAGKAEMFGQ